jgi:hypothetical protein
MVAGCGAGRGSPPPSIPPAPIDTATPGPEPAPVSPVDGPLPQPDAAAAADAPPPVAAGRIVVKAGARDRQKTVVSFMLGPPARTLTLRDGDARIPLQVDDSGRAVFVLPALAAGAEAHYTVEPGPGLPAVVRATKEADGVTVALAGATAFRYQMQGKLPPGIEPQYLRGGYLHPILTPAGVLVSNDYPSDHHNAHGLWSAWAPVTFEGKNINFWAMGERTGKGDFDALLGTWDGPVHGGVRTRQVQVSLAGPQPKTALREVWVVTLYNVPGVPYFQFDLDSTQETASDAAVMIQQHIYGGFALRGHSQWGNNADFLTSEGKTRANGDGTNARWCFIGGRVDGKPVGYAALGHPDNFRFPQPLRINPTDPFFSLAPARAGPFAIVPGKPYVSHFRIVALDGPPDRALLDQLWEDYAHPPEVSVLP